MSFLNGTFSRPRVHKFHQHIPGFRTSEPGPATPGSASPGSQVSPAHPRVRKLLNPGTWRYCVEAKPLMFFTVSPGSQVSNPGNRRHIPGFASSLLRIPGFVSPASLSLSLGRGPGFMAARTSCLTALLFLLMSQPGQHRKETFGQLHPAFQEAIGLGAWVACTRNGIKKYLQDASADVSVEAALRVAAHAHPPKQASPVSCGRSPITSPLSLVGTRKGPLLKEECVTDS